MKLVLPALVCSALLLSSTAFAQGTRIRTIAGTGVGAYSGDGGYSTAAELHAPLDVKLDKTGNVYVLDLLNYRIRKISTTGVISTVAGTGVAGYTGDGSISTSANMRPYGFAVDNGNNIYIADASYGVIRKVNTAGIISTIAGTGIQGNTGNGGPALSAQMNGIYGLAVDTAGSIYVVDAISNTVRIISKTGTIDRFAGNDTAGYSGDGGFASEARLDSPYAIALDHKGNAYISDMLNNVVRKVDAMGIISTYAGNGMQGYTGDGGPAISASLNRPAGLTVDADGNVYIADADNDVIRKVDTFGNILTVIGNGTPGFGGDLGPVLGCNLHTPFGVAADGVGDIYIADANNQRIRKTYTPVSVNETSKIVVDAYPNPVTNKLFLTGLTVGDNLYVLDVTGRKLVDMKAANESETLKMSSLSAGIYFLHIVNKSGTEKTVVKLVKE